MSPVGSKAGSTDKSSGGMYEFTHVKNLLAALANSESDKVSCYDALMRGERTSQIYQTS